MERNSGVTTSVSALRLRARQWRGTEQLRRLCVDLVSHFYPRNWLNAAPCILAAEILSDQFGHSVETGRELETHADEFCNPTAIVIALCSAWPDSSALERLSVPREGHPLLVPAQFHLLSRAESPDEFVSRLGNALSKLTGDIWEFLPTCVRAVRSRFERDASVRNLAFERLTGSATPAEKANFPQFLRWSDTRVERLLTWCQGEYDQQIDREQLPDLALDVSSGTVRSVAHLLLELIGGCP